MPDAVTASPQTSSSPPPAGQDARERFHRTRWVAIIAGLLGMNVGGLPLAEHPNGFWIVVSVVLAFTAVAGVLVVRMQRGPD